MDAHLMLESQTKEDIIYLMTEELGVDNYIERDDCIIFPTICHNVDNKDASMKLYYYFENKRFHCYTDCGDTFDLYELFKRYYELRKIKITFYEILKKVAHGKTYNVEAPKGYISEKNKYLRKNRKVQLPSYPKGLLDLYCNNRPEEWLCEGITSEVLKKFNIKMDVLGNKIIIPHYDIDDNLVGIRNRALNDSDIECYGKYAPIYVEEKSYGHPLSLNLYGINFNKVAIAKSHKVILFESEKSVLLYEAFFGAENNIALAVCGSTFHKTQLEILLKFSAVNEIVIAFDKEYQIYPSKQSTTYFNKINNICKRYNKYCDMSFIFDMEELLEYKDSPIDKSKNTFIKLLKKRVRLN